MRAISATISDFAFPFCDAQLARFSIIFVASACENRPSNFVICLLCEIGPDERNVTPRRFASMRETRDDEEPLHNPVGPFSSQHFHPIELILANRPPKCLTGPWW
jgi:hypothetical protein